MYLQKNNELTLKLSYIQGLHYQSLKCVGPWWPTEGRGDSLPGVHGGPAEGPQVPGLGEPAEGPQVHRGIAEVPGVCGGPHHGVLGVRGGPAEGPGKYMSPSVTEGRPSGPMGGSEESLEGSVGSLLGPTSSSIGESYGSMSLHSITGLGPNPDSPIRSRPRTPPQYSVPVEVSSHTLHQSYYSSPAHGCDGSVRGDHRLATSGMGWSSPVVSGRVSSSARSAPSPAHTGSGVRVRPLDLSPSSTIMVETLEKSVHIESGTFDDKDEFLDVTSCPGGGEFSYGTNKDTHVNLNEPPPVNTLSNVEENVLKDMSNTSVAYTSTPPPSRSKSSQGQDLEDPGQQYEAPTSSSENRDTVTVVPPDSEGELSHEFTGELLVTRKTTSEQEAVITPSKNRIITSTETQIKGEDEDKVDIDHLPDTVQNGAKTPDNRLHTPAGLVNGIIPHITEGTPINLTERNGVTSIPGKAVRNITFSPKTKTPKKHWLENWKTPVDGKNSSVKLKVFPTSNALSSNKGCFWVARSETPDRDMIPNKNTWRLYIACEGKPALCLLVHESANLTVCSLSKAVSQMYETLNLPDMNFTVCINTSFNPL